MVRRVTSVLLIAAVLASAGCSGHGAVVSTGPPAPSPAASWLPGEFRQQVDFCRAVSAGVLRRLRVETSSGAECAWRRTARDTEAGVHGHLLVSGVVYEPDRIVKRSATSRAQREFAHPKGWEGLGPSMPVHGFGDEAKIVESFNPSTEHSEIHLAVRERNAFIQVYVEEESLLDRSEGLVPPFSDVEAGAFGAVADGLARLGKPVAPVNRSRGVRPGEVSSVHQVCASVDAGRLVPGVSRHDIGPEGSRLRGGCNWSENDGEKPELTVYAQAFTPTPATGRTASQVAAGFFAQWRGRTTGAPKLGDETKTSSFRSNSGRFLESSILVRRGNLLVYVTYGSWNHPAVNTLDREVTNIAKSVLAGNG